MQSSCTRPSGARPRCAPPATGTWSSAPGPPPLRSPRRAATRHLLRAPPRFADRPRCAARRPARAHGRGDTSPTPRRRPRHGRHRWRPTPRAPRRAPPPRHQRVRAAQLCTPVPAATLIAPAACRTATSSAAAGVAAPAPDGPAPAPPSARPLALARPQQPLPHSRKVRGRPPLRYAVSPLAQTPRSTPTVGPRRHRPAPPRRVDLRNHRLPAPVVVLALPAASTTGRPPQPRQRDPARPATPNLTVRRATNAAHRSRGPAGDATGATSSSAASPPPPPPPRCDRPGNPPLSAPSPPVAAPAPAPAAAGR